MTRNVDEKTAGGFGREWSTFTQSDRELTDEQRARVFADYFAIFPWETLPAQGATGIDVGCGSGRWAVLVAPRVARLHVARHQCRGARQWHEPIWRTFPT